MCPFDLAARCRESDSCAKLLNGPDSSASMSRKRKADERSIRDGDNSFSMFDDDDDDADEEDNDHARCDSHGRVSSLSVSTMVEPPPPKRAFISRESSPLVPGDDAKTGSTTPGTSSPANARNTRFVN